MTIARALAVLLAAAPLSAWAAPEISRPVLLAQAEEAAPVEGEEAPAAPTPEEPPPEDRGADAAGPAEPAEPAAQAAQPAGSVPGAPAILRDVAQLPEPTRRTWEALVAAARSGDIERLRPLIEAQPEPPTLAFDEIDDPIRYLRSLSGDPAGREILAVLLEVLEAGFVHADAGTPDEMYVWPYFARYPIDGLTPEQLVELFTLVAAGEYQDMRSFGAYISFRVGIGPDGVWHFFVAGD